LNHHFIPAFIFLLVSQSTLFAQEEKPKLFRWGADKTGGAPYLFDDPQGKLIGFEVELADYFAKELGRKSEYVQGDWSKLPELLGRGDDIDVVMNGYEFDTKLEAQYPSTRPYYVYTLRLVANGKDDSLEKWEDLRVPKGQPKKRVGVLTGSAAHRYLQKTFGDEIEILANDDVANVYEELERQEKFDATVQDSVSASYFVRESEGKLKLVGQGRAPGYYVLLTRPEDKELREQLNAAILKALKSGKLKEIYKKYELWTPEQGQLFYWAEEEWPPKDFEPSESATGEVDWRVVFEKLFTAAGMTILLTCLSMPLAMLIGLLVAIGRLYGPLVVRVLLTIYVEVVRGTPLLLQLYAVFYLLPRVMNLDFLDPVHFAIIGLAINYSAYEAENYRAGLLAVPRGQMEAALALGMTQTQALRHVVVPQAVRIVIPPVTNDFIALFKDTSVCSIILVTELTRQYNELYNGNRDIIVELAAITAGMYMLMSYPLSLLARRLEHQSPSSRV